MMRRLLNISVAISASLLLAVAFLALRSIWHLDYYVVHTSSSRTYQAAIYEGKLCLAVSETHPPPKHEMKVAIKAVQTSTGDNGTISSIQDPDGGPIGVYRTHASYIIIPLIAVLFILLLPPAAWWWRRHRAMVARQFQESQLMTVEHLCCTHCGYDLHATPDRCPECGLVQGAV